MAFNVDVVPGFFISQPHLLSVIYTVMRRNCDERFDRSLVYFREHIRLTPEMRW